MLNTLAPDAFVAKQLYHTSGGWNTDLVRQIFLTFEASDILNVTLYLHLDADQLVWSCIRNCFHSLKSAYHVFLNLKHYMDQAGTSFHDPSNTLFWKI